MQCSCFFLLCAQTKSPGEGIVATQSLHINRADVELGPPKPYVPSVLQDSVKTMVQEACSLVETETQRVKLQPKEMEQFMQRQRIHVCNLWRREAAPRGLIQPLHIVQGHDNSPARRAHTSGIPIVFSYITVGVRMFHVRILLNFPYRINAHINP